MCRTRHGPGRPDGLEGDARVLGTIKGRSARERRADLPPRLLKLCTRSCTTPFKDLRDPLCKKGYSGEDAKVEFKQGISLMYSQ